MGELGVLPEDLPRYVEDGIARHAGHDGEAGRAGEGNRITERDLQRLGDAGRDVNSAALDVARTVCRRAERQVAC